MIKFNKELGIGQALAGHYNVYHITCETPTNWIVDGKCVKCNKKFDEELIRKLKLILQLKKPI